MKISGIILFTLSVVSSLPQKILKREDSADRSQDAAIGGALRGFVIPDLSTLFPTNPLGGNPPDDD